jgi:hypothetical protein
MSNCTVVKGCYANERGGVSGDKGDHGSFPFVK